MEKLKNIIREFAVSTWSVNNRKTVFVITGIILLGGLFSYISMPKENFPEMIVPQIYVGTAYPGNSPSDMEKLITRPLEKEIKSINGVDKITSTSMQGYSTILVEFNFDVSPTEALRKVKDAVDKATSDKDFPKDLPMDPNIFELNFSEFPIMNINLSGDFSVEQLKRYAEFLEDEIENLSEISKVEIRGVEEKEVKIEVDMHKMEAMQISFQDIENAVASENLTISGGEILTENQRRTVRVSGDFTSMEELKNVIIKQEHFNIVYLKDIADVKFEEAETKSYAREYSQPVVMLDVIKRGGENLLDASAKINEILEKSKKTEFPENLIISVTNDQSNKTRNQVDNLENSIISGVILVVLVLMFFLGLRNALFVGIAIPLSMFMAFMILGAMGVTLNLIVLFSLILALGMLVDNGIVVVENIYRMRSEGLSIIDAAKQGVGEVAWPIISSTATTLAAFLPLAFWPGMMGEFMQYLPITLITVLGSSLFVGLVINPALAASFMKTEETKSNKKSVLKRSAIFAGIGILFIILKIMVIGNLLMLASIFAIFNFYLLQPATVAFQNKILPKLEAKYESILLLALRGKNARNLFLGTFGLLFFSFILMFAFTPNVKFFPENEPAYINIFIEKPIGTDINITNKTTQKVEKIVNEIASKYNEKVIENGNEVTRNFLINSLIAQVGEGTSDPAQGASMGNTPHKARVTVSFVEYEFRRGINTNDVMEEIRKNLEGIPGVNITVDKNQNGPPRKKPINIEVTGIDYDSLISYAVSIKNKIDEKNISGVEELKLDVETGLPELVVDVDRNKARRFNVSTFQVASTIRTALFGKEISTYKDGDDDYPIQLRLKDNFRYSQDLLLNQKITFRDQSNGQIRQIPLSTITSPVYTSTYSAVKRKNFNRIVSISSNISEGKNPNEVVSELKNIMKDYKLPEGYNFKFTGEQEDQEKEMAFLSKALLIAVFLIFLIIVAQFNSVSAPLIIVSSVVLSLIGVLLGLVIFRMDFIVIMTMIGIISLAGVVVNNAIVLIDYTMLLISKRKAELNLDESDKLSIEDTMHCIIASGKTRLRPVLLTAITTVLGLIPLATGMNINFFTLLSDYNANIYFGGDNVLFWGPMSWTVIFGLSFATFLTLIIVPVMYFLLIKVKYRFLKS
jgi:multidrug efflux pump subunit AcrB